MSNNCPCPPGYVPDSSGQNCIKTTSVSPTVSSTIYTVGTGDKNGNYGVLGAKFYQNISALHFPITYTGSCVASDNFKDSAGTVLAVTNTIINSVWGDGNIAHGRLNNAGVWTTPPYSNPNDQTSYNNGDSPPIYQWIGFSVCVDVPTTGTYCIGMAGDNGCRFWLNGNKIVELYAQDPTLLCSISKLYTFKAWHIFPITLNAGVNIITVEGLNDAAVAAFGAEIYNATPTQLAAIATPAQLSAVTIFTTANKIGQTFDTGENSGYSCPSGYSLSTCGPTPMCSITESVPYQCCYLLTNCVDGTTLVASNDLSQYVGQVVTLQGHSGSWTVTTAPNCTGSVPLAVISVVQGGCPPCYRLVNCVTGQQVITSTDLSGSVGMVVTFPGTDFPGCWTVTTASNCTGAVVVPSVATTSPNCVPCLPCFVLTNCQTGVTIQTNSPISGYVGQTVQIEGYPGVCWTVTASTGCTQVTPVVIVSAYTNCASCLPACYLLRNCASGDPTPTIITNTDLGAYVGQVIQIKDCVGQCWLVEKADTCTGAKPVVVVTSFKTCTDCNPPLVCPPPELLHQRKVKPGYNTPGCSPEYTDEVNCEFAEQIWNLVKRRRYGITVCCSEDLEKYIIKKELLDLDAIYDKKLCVTCPPITCCTPCPTPPLPIPPIPIECIPPTNLVATIEVSSSCSDATGPESAVIVFNKATTTGFTPPKIN